MYVLKITVISAKERFIKSTDSFNEILKNNYQVFVYLKCFIQLNLKLVSEANSKVWWREKYQSVHFYIILLKFIIFVTKIMNFKMNLDTWILCQDFSEFYRQRNDSEITLLLFSILNSVLKKTYNYSEVFILSLCDYHI